MEKIRVGIIGAGANTRKMHLPNLKSIPDIDIVAVVNRTRESAAKVAKEFDIPQIYDHWTELIAAPDLDAVVIGTWPYLHAPAAIAAIEAGKHVLTEARMCMDYAEAQEMYWTHQAHPELVAQIVPAPYTLAADQTIRRLLTEGRIGRILAVRIDDFGSLAQGSATIHWRNVKKFSGVNTLALGIHYEALLRWIGHVQWVQAQTAIQTPYLVDAHGLKTPTAVPDYVALQAEFPGGIPLTMNLSSQAAFGPPNGFYLFGADGTLFFNLTERKLYLGQRQESTLQPVTIPENEARGWRVEADFVSAIRQQTEVTLTSFFDGLRYMAFTEAVHLAAVLGKRVRVPQASENLI